MPDEPSWKILLIGSDAETAAAIRTMLPGAPGSACDLHWAEDLLRGLERLAKGDIQVVLMELPGAQGLDAVAALRLHAPALPVIILSNQEREGFALRALEIGAQDYWIKAKLEPESLFRSLRCALVRHKVQALAKNESPAPAVRVIGCLGAKGGVGTTTIACLAGLELKRQTGQRVLLADFNLSGDLVGFLTKATSSYSLLDAANDLLRLDLSFWEQVVSDGPEELEVLPLAPPTASQPQVLLDRSHGVQRFLRTVYSWMVLDLGRLNPFSASLLCSLTDLLLVTRLEPAAVFQTRQTMQRLAELGLDSSCVTLVVNHVPKMEFVAALELPKLLGIRGCAILPEGSVDLGDRKNSVRPHMVRLAARLAGVEQKPPAWKLFPFLPRLAARRELKVA
jgi:pilus assembly protein CpaE